MFGIDKIDFASIDYHTRNGMMPNTLQQEAREAIQLAKLGTGVIIGLQAIAAIAAFGMFIIQFNQYTRNKSKSKSRRSR